MAPSVQEIVQPAEEPVVSTEKLISIAKEAPKSDSPRVKRQIETEGGKTDAKVCHHSLKFRYITKFLSILTIFQLGIMARNTLHLSRLNTSNGESPRILPFQICFHQAAKQSN
jgi:hypothetical protein